MDGRDWLHQDGAARLLPGPDEAAYFPAEAYHQDYAVLHPNQLYIVYNDAPKVANLKRLFPEVWREKPVLVSEADRTN